MKLDLNYKTYGVNGQEYSDVLDSGTKKELLHVIKCYREMIKQGILHYEDGEKIVEVSFHMTDQKTGRCVWE
jgi:hypothetical protein